MNSKGGKEICKNCSEPLKTKGSDFYSPKCENSNEKKVSLKHSHRITANKKILKKLESENIKIVSRKKLLDAGFNFDYYSEYFRHMLLTDKIYFFGYGLEELGFNRYEIIRGY